MSLDIEAITGAKRRISPYINQTPIVSSNLLNQWIGHKIYFKAECLQKVGAFKARGACNAIASLVEQGMAPRKIVANSSGNHAQAISWAASCFGIPSTIYMPANVSTVKAQATAGYGAEVVLCETRAIADERVKEAANEEGCFWIPPYNHEHVIAGQGTAAYEALSELNNVDAVFAPCGGGGLLSGSYISTKSLTPNAKVIGAEPLNANDAVESVRRGKIQSLSKPPETLADGAMTLSVGDITFEYLQQLDEFYEIKEQAIVYWTQWLNHLLKVRVEPTSAMSMDAVCRWLSTQKSEKSVLVVLSGGNIAQQTAAKIWQQDYLHEIPSCSIRF